MSSHAPLAWAEKNTAPRDLRGSLSATFPTPSWLVRTVGPKRGGRPSPGIYTRGRLQTFSDSPTITESYQEYCTRLVVRLSEATWDPDLGIEVPTPLALTGTLAILIAVGRTGSIYPAIAPDGDGGLDVAWKADGSVLRFSVDPDGETTLWVPQRFGPPLHGVPLDQDGRKALTLALEALSRYVDATNPAWRRWFRD